MNHQEAEATLALLRHIDGSEVQVVDALMDDIKALFNAAAAVPRGGALPLDLDCIEATLEAIGTWFEEDLFYDEEPERPTQDVQLNGDVL